MTNVIEHKLSCWDGTDLSGNITIECEADGISLKADNGIEFFLELNPNGAYQMRAYMDDIDSPVCMAVKGTDVSFLTTDFYNEKRAKEAEANA